MAIMEFVASQPHASGINGCLVAEPFKFIPSRSDGLRQGIVLVDDETDSGSRIESRL